MHSVEQQHIMLALRDNRLFSLIAPTHHAAMASIAQRRAVPDKTTIVRKGETGDEMFALVSGRVVMTSLSPEGKELTLGYLGAGDIFGEIALLDGGPRTANVTAIEPCELLVFRRKVFLQFLRECPDVAINFLTLLASRLRNTDQTLEDSSLRQLPCRLARRLINLATDFGHATLGGVKIPIRLSQQDIGNMTGATRESVNRQLRDWEGRGVIALEQGYITIVDRARLASFAD